MLSHELFAEMKKKSEDELSKFVWGFDDFSNVEAVFGP
jgi:hypothetical protein